MVGKEGERQRERERGCSSESSNESKSSSNKEEKEERNSRNHRTQFSSFIAARVSPCDEANMRRVPLQLMRNMK